MKRFRIALSLLTALLMCIGVFCAALAEENASSGYGYGDVIADFTLTTPEGESYTLSTLLEQYKAVVLNFWFADCSPCRMEFPYMEEAYQDFQDDLIILAITPYDDDDRITAFKAELGLTFPMMRDTAGISNAFVYEGFPTTIVVDRFGVYCYYECGSMPDKDMFVRLFTPFVADDYTESLVGFEIPAPQPTVSMPDAAEVASALNVEGGQLTFSADENAWPFLLDSDGNRTYAYASNTGINNTTAVLHAGVTANSGDVLTFEYKVSSEAYYDFMTFSVNGEVKKVFSGEQDWSTYAYAFEETGEYDVAFGYVKDSSESGGDDVACVAQVAVLSGEEAEAALAAVPVKVVSLEGDATELLVSSEGAREFLVSDPADSMALYFGDSLRCYIVPGGTADLKVLIGDEIDVDAAMVYSNYDGSAVSLAEAETDAEGYVISGIGIDSVETTGYSWSLVSLYPFYQGDTSQSVLLFASEENVNYFFQIDMVDEAGLPIEGLTWAYADGAAPSTDAIAAANGEIAAVDYTLTFVDADQNPVAGVIANVCDDDICAPMVADQDGVIAFSYPGKVYDVHVLMVPDGYTCDPNEGFQTSAEGGNLTIVLEKAE